MRNAGLDESQTEIKIARRNINNLRYVDDTILVAEKVKVKVAQSCLALCNPMGYAVHWILQARIMEWVAISFSIKPTFSLSSFTFIRRLFSSYTLSAIRVVSSAYLRFLIFLPAILILACTSSSRAFRMMYSAHKLNKQDNNIQP